MSYKLIAVLTAVLLAGPALADDQKGGRGGPGGKGDRMARMQEHLQLSDDQVSEMRRIRESGGGREQMFGILNDTQRTQLEQHRANRKSGHGSGGGRREAPPET